MDFTRVKKILPSLPLYKLKAREILNNAWNIEQIFEPAEINQ